MINRTKLFLLVLGLFILSSSVSARTVVYNFSSTYENVSMFGYYCSRSDEASLPPTGVIPACKYDITDTTFDADLDSSDDGYVGATSAYTQWQLYHARLSSSIEIEDIISLNWLVEAVSASTKTFNIYMWNFTNSSYTNLVNSSDDSDDKNYSLNSTAISNILNSSLDSYLVLHGVGGGSGFETDFVQLTIDYTPKVNVTLISPPDSFNTTSSWNNFSCNYTSSSGISLINATAYLWNTTGTVNKTNSTFITGTSNSTNLTLNLSDGTFNWNCLAYNGDNQYGWGESNRTLLVDTTPPAVSIVYPANLWAYNNFTLSLNYTVSDSGIGLQSCVFQNNTDSNVSIACGTNTTISQGADGFYTVTVCANDSLGNIGCDTNSYTISSSAPAISLNYPPNATYFNRITNIYLNYTATDSDGIDTCKTWHDLNGSFSENQTNKGGKFNFTLVNTSSDGLWSWNVWCNDTNGDASFSPLNFTFFTDTTYPNISINSITTTTGSQTITFAVNSSDTNLNTCKYTIFNSTGGIDGIYENITINCNLGATSTVSAYGTYNLTFYAIDKAGNENLTTMPFTTVPTPIIPVPGGGGGTLSALEQIPVIALKPIADSEKEYNELERAVIFSSINNYCAFSISREEIATKDYSEECLITIEDLRIIIQNMAEFEVLSTENDMAKFFQNYKNKLFEQVFASKDEIVKYNLFSSVLGLISRLQIFPSPDYDSYTAIYQPSLGSFTVPIEKISNKPLASCEVLSQTLELTCELENRTLIHIKYKIPETDFLTRSFSGKLLVTTDATPENVETQQLSITIRAINLGSSKAKIIGLSAGIVLIVSAVLFKGLKPKKNKTIEQLKDIVKLK